MKNPTKNTQIYALAEVLGLAVYSTNYQNPGRRYQLGLTGEYGSFTALSPNMTAAEALYWLNGFSARHTLEQAHVEKLERLETF